MELRVFISAAESSGDANAAALADAIRVLRPGVELRGIGGPKMAAAGVGLLAETTSRAAMGIAAAARVSEGLGLLKLARGEYQHSPPDLAICVDSWSLNRHFAALAKQHQRPVLYFVAPQAWAWREGRVVRMRQCIDHLACLLPFEAEWYRHRGVAATYVGHPLFDRLAVPTARRRNMAAPPTIGLLTGSRTSEARKNWPRLAAVARGLALRFPGVRFLVPTTDTTHATVMADTPANAVVRQDAFDEFVAQCDLCITVSGTATLHVAMHGVPMLIVYAGSRLLWETVGRWVIPTRTFGLINLLAADEPRPEPTTQIMPEFIPWSGSVQPVLDTATAWLSDPALLHRKSQELVKVIGRIHRPGAAAAAAAIALGLAKK
jgi:lipid-A-disaccharide synthase